MASLLLGRLAAAGLSEGTVEELEAAAVAQTAQGLLLAAVTYKVTSTWDSTWAGGTVPPPIPDTAYSVITIG
ncbi:MAG TPA: hypothetical protein VFV67_16775 [Actinophytocola sp.]|uniref:hypothetical protein n=1 Tax=Actinophytocola sp. TaxID=1872138 RepID=UPI002DB8507D|nr:hypothetical protein [Actinophytocola sp.]HEU5472308.1 hypothetical protein [Actinophytocola sp.]